MSHRPLAWRLCVVSVEHGLEGSTMMVMGYLAVTGIGFLWLMTRAPLWRAFEISIDQGLESGAREPGSLS
ncbi:MAG: hypothetical protein ABIR25_08035 [Sphingomicrobium sp.]